MELLGEGRGPHSAVAIHYVPYLFLDDHNVRKLRKVHRAADQSAGQSASQFPPAATLNSVKGGAVGPQ